MLRQRNKFEQVFGTHRGIHFLLRSLTLPWSVVNRTQGSLPSMISHVDVWLREVKSAQFYLQLNGMLGQLLFVVPRHYFENPVSRIYNMP